MAMQITKEGISSKCFISSPPLVSYCQSGGNLDKLFDFDFKKYKIVYSKDSLLDKKEIISLKHSFPLYFKNCFTDLSQFSDDHATLQTAFIFNQLDSYILWLI